MKKIIAAAILMISAIGYTQTAQVRNISEYNLEQGVGLKGYDPVSYFTEGGAVPAVGQKQITLDYMGVQYFFATAENLNLFVKNPNKYEPTYGGFCAYAMASGAKVDINPMLFTIHGNRAHFFVSKRAKQNFDADIDGFEKRADDFFFQISGELPRK
jgi:YHS domain-containing protein